MAALLKEPTGEEPVRVLRPGVIFLKADLRGSAGNLRPGGLKKRQFYRKRLVQNSSTEPRSGFQSGMPSQRTKREKGRRNLMSSVEDLMVFSCFGSDDPQHSPPRGSEGLSNPEEVKGGRRPTFIHLMNHSDSEEILLPERSPR
jgi:hypothetical protein